MIIRTPNGGEFTEITLRDILYAPNLGCTLISIGRIDDTRCTVTFKGGTCFIQNQENQVITQIPKMQGLYRVEHDESSAYALTTEVLTLDKLHRRHGHIAHSTLEKMVKGSLIQGIKLNPSPITPCKPCLLTKAKRKPIPTS